MVRKMMVCSLFAGLLVFLAACGTAKRVSSAQPLIANTPLPSSGSLSITSTNAFTDQFGSYHVVGAVKNSMASALTALQLTIVIKDASGNSLLKNDSGAVVPSLVFSPMLPILGPGETSPFDFSYDTRKGKPANYTVKIAGYQSGKVDRAPLQVGNPQITDDQKGTLYLSGKLINTNKQWVHINALAGSVVDAGEAPLSAGSSFIFDTELAPAGDSQQRDQTPFVISFPSPGAGQVNWRIYWDANLDQAPADYATDLAFTNSYFDQNGNYHIVGYLTNKASTALNPLLIAGLYVQDGTVLDAAYSFLTSPVDPGKRIPFDLSYFGSVNSNKAQASRMRTFTVQVDPARTKVPDTQSVELAASGVQIRKDGAVWAFSGAATNNTGKTLSGATVIVTVTDAQNNLVAVVSSNVLPSSGSYSPGSGISYQLVASLDPTVDSSGFKTTTMVIGDYTK